MHLGDVLTLEAPEITRAGLALYAGASGDHNPVHIDTDECQAVGIPDVFAHGMLSMAYLGRLLTDRVPQQRLQSFGVRFCTITPLHARPTCSATVVSVHDGLAHLELRVTLADGTETLRGSATVRID